MNSNKRQRAGFSAFGCSTAEVACLREMGGLLAGMTLVGMALGGTAQNSNFAPSWSQRGALTRAP
jgi:hypothetical protein